MKSILFFQTLVCLGVCAISQTSKAQNPDSLAHSSQALPIPPVEEKEINYTFYNPEEMPEPIGGMSEFYKYLSRNFKYPASYARMCVEGRIFLKFTVQKDGTLADIRVIKSLDPDLDAEAVRVLQEYPHKWKPGKQNGRVVDVKISIPFKIELRANYDGRKTINSQEKNDTENQTQQGEKETEKEPALRSDTLYTQWEKFEQKDFLKFQLFPNPSTDYFTLDIHTTEAQVGRITAQCIKPGSREIVLWENGEVKNNMCLNFSALWWEKGVYVLKIKTSTTAYTQLLILN